LAKENAASIIKTRELDLKEKELALEAYVEGASNLLNREEKAKDRQLKQTQDALKILAELSKTTDNENLQKGMAVLKLLEQQMKETNKVNIEQIKKGD